ncbi:MAG: carboxy-S-adenosyl-L-methionine synthase CmoA [Gammaproteobacteria bacterium]|nr:carboxy-S-adenosyl-L-methionine synthase CmoA [Gammaproteobacteria bacterium]
MSGKTTRDDMYATRVAAPGDFVFDETVAAVFPDMISRSVPGYPAIINMITLLADRYAQPGSTLCDLGCSLGASTVALATGAAGRNCHVIGVDNAPAMLDRARALSHADHPAIVWRCEDVRTVGIADASVVVLNFTLQFLPVDDRLALLNRVHEGLRPGGVLILSEKVAGTDEQANDLLVEMHHAFKRANGYSELEISRKRSALESVLVPETLERHRARLEDAGFARCDVWFQCFNFVSMVARR